MSKTKLQLWLILSFIGLLGVLSLLLSELPLQNLPPEVTENINPQTLKWLVLINPAILVLVLTLIGTLVYDKVKFTVPILEGLLRKETLPLTQIKQMLVGGALAGVVAGVLIVGITALFKPYLPAELLAQTEQATNMHLLTKLLYGGITEELLMRFCLMSVIAWILFKISGKLNSAIFYAAIVIAAFLFAIGHFPALFMLVAEPTTVVYAYIITGNMAGGLLFGYAYWKFGLEAAMLAHAFAHIVMTIGAMLVG